MKKGLFSKIWPHILAIVIFLLVALVFCKPALTGKVLNQSDIRNALGAMENSVAYSKTHDGKYPAWNNGLFSGMPAYQIGGVADNSIAVYVTKVLTLGLPKPFQFFFLACVCFYILCVCLRINPFVGILGSLAFAYTTYNPVIVSVGHDTKMLSIAYMPAVLAGVMLIFQKKYWIGGLLTALFTSAMIGMNHVQIVYYLLIVLGVFFIYKLIVCVREKQLKHLVIASAIALVAGLAGVLSNALLLYTTYDYQKYTIRGGSSEQYVTKKDQPQTTGLDKGYALSYSYNITEPLVLVFPKMFGGSSDKEEVKQDQSKAIEALQAMPQELAGQMPLRYYWGGMTKEGEVGSSGPSYIGVVIVVLAILSFFVKSNKHRWWILTCLAISFVLSWGSYFDTVNNFLFNHLPFYNKFRAPSMIMVIPQLLLPLAAAIGLSYLLNNNAKPENATIFKQTLIASGALILVGLLLYFSFDYLSYADKSILTQVNNSNQPQLYQYIKSFFDGLTADRKSLFISSIFRSFFIMAIVLFLVFLYIRDKVKGAVLVAVCTVLAMIDIFMVNSTYFNDSSFVEDQHFDAEITPSKVDEEILRDTSYYRVFNVNGSFSENITSFLYKSTGGYHPAKLRIYQDLIEYQLGKQPLNMPVFNMLNTKYFIAKDANGITQQYQKNDSALGPCWLVKNVTFVNTADEEMKMLDHVNAKDSAYVLSYFKQNVPLLPQQDSTASIQLVKNDNDVIDYTFNSKANQFAVFSEIFYPSGWKAFIDGKEAPIARVNYVLRGLSVPAGSHHIQFKFEPKSVATAKSLAKISWALLLVLFAMFIYSFINNRKKQAEKAVPQL